MRLIDSDSFSQSRMEVKTALRFRLCVTGWKMPPGWPYYMAHPGVIINWFSSVLECRDAVACSEVPAFRYELALGQVEQEMAERCACVHCPSSTARLLESAGAGFGGGVRKGVLR